MTTRPRLLDLCCKAGGASAGYHAAGFDVTGVDLEPQPDYPFTFIQADALTVDLTGYEVVTASPPCQAYSQATPTHRRHQHPDLIEPIRARLADAVNTPAGLPWAYIIENVPGAPLHNPVTVCGETLRLGVRRHRLFESNLPLHGTPCWHDRPEPAVPVYGSYGQRRRRNPIEGETSRHTTDQARAAMGITWMPWPALTQAIPPTYTFWLGLQLLTHRPHTTRDESPELWGSVTRRRETSPSDESTAVLSSPDSRDGTDLVASITGTCRHCDQPLPTRPATGRWPRYCTHACRQAAYRQRRTRRTA